MAFEKPTDYVEIQTERLLIRPLKTDDAKAVFDIRSSPEFTKWTPHTPQEHISEAESWIADCLARSNCWTFVMELLEPPDEHKVIGLVGAIRLPEVGYAVHPDHWGKGYATEAMKAYIPVYFEHVPRAKDGGYDYARADINPGNAASKKIAEKCNFVFIEQHKEDYWSPALGWSDVAVYRVPRPGTKIEAKDATSGIA